MSQTDVNQQEPQDQDDDQGQYPQHPPERLVQVAYAAFGLYAVGLLDAADWVIGDLLAQQIVSPTDVERLLILAEAEAGQRLKEARKQDPSDSSISVLEATFNRIGKILGEVVMDNPDNQGE